MKAYRITVIVCDDEGAGEDGCVRFVCSSKYASIQHVSTEALEIGEWRDDHPLNQGGKAGVWFDKMIKGKVDA